MIQPVQPIHLRNLRQSFHKTADISGIFTLLSTAEYCLNLKKQPIHSRPLFFQSARKASRPLSVSG